MTGNIIALGALVVTVMNTTVWLKKAFAGKLPSNRIPTVLVWLSSAALGVIALDQEPNLLGKISAYLAILGSFLFVLTVAISKQKVGDDVIKVGDTIPSFTSLDDTKTKFNSEELAGSPVLIKFFRGHWCPYCAGELVRWEALRPEFDKYDVRIVTVSAETPEKIAEGRLKHGLKAVMLADRNLKVIDKFGLRNKGVHSGPPRIFGAPALPVPTALLVDTDGKVLWKDQSENYQQRTDPEYVLGALREHFGEPAIAN